MKPIIIFGVAAGVLAGALAATSHILPPEQQRLVADVGWSGLLVGLFVAFMVYAIRNS